VLHAVPPRLLSGPGAADSEHSSLYQTRSASGVPEQLTGSGDERSTASSTKHESLGGDEHQAPKHESLKGDGSELGRAGLGLRDVAHHVEGRLGEVVVVAWGAFWF